MDGYDELRVGGVTLRGVTRGGIQTSLFCPELGALFDVGGKMPGQLKASTILVSHGHHDHLGGLPNLVSERNMLNLPPLAVHVPWEIVAPLRTIFEAWSIIEDFPLRVDLQGHAPDDRVALGRGLAAIALRSVHRVPSLCWLVERSTPKLKTEYGDLERAELMRLRDAGVPITEDHTIPLLAVTGDTQIELFDRDARLRQCKVLVHEVTGWDERRSVEEVRAWGHTHVDEMIPRAERFEGEALVLVHRSPRHSRAEAEAIVERRFPASVRDRVHVFGH